MQHQNIHQKTVQHRFWREADHEITTDTVRRILTRLIHCSLPVKQDSEFWELFSLRSTTTFPQTRNLADRRTRDLGRMTKRLFIGSRAGCRLDSWVSSIEFPDVRDLGSFKPKRTHEDLCHFSIKVCWCPEEKLG